jgi:hypothetical protein
MPIRLLPERYFATRASDQKGAYGRLGWDWPAYTITNEAHNVTAGPFTHPEQDRPLSVREAARLQSFADNHEFHGPILSQYKQVGNAAPPGLAKAVAEAILYCHHCPEQATEWGRPGRISVDVLRRARRGEATFPVLTPRFVQPNFERGGSTVPSPDAEDHELPRRRQAVWNADPRPDDPFPEDTLQLRELAKQPKNYRAAKRAQAIVSFIDGIPKAEITTTARKAEANVQRWVEEYYAGGLDGWRAYHTPTRRIARFDHELSLRMTNAIRRIRQVDTTVANNGSSSSGVPKRLYMNSYLLELRQRFGALSVSQLIRRAEERLGGGVGTVYVGDLLAICDVLLSEPERVDNSTRSI